MTSPPFILCQPGRRKSSTDSDLDLSRIRSHVAVFSHKVKKATKAKKTRSRTSQVSLTCAPPWRYECFVRDAGTFNTFQRHTEAKSLNYFLDRTAVECSGWHDYEFWTRTVPQTAALHTTMLHAMTAIGAYHESLESPVLNRANACRAICVEEGNRALNCYNKQRGQMSLAALTCCRIVFTEFALAIGDITYLNSLHVLSTLVDGLQNQPTATHRHTSASDRHFIATYLAPLVDKQRSRVCRMNDPLSLLRDTDASHFYVSELSPCPNSFASLWHARQSLEAFLNWTTYTVKTKNFAVNDMPPESKSWFNHWLVSLQRSEDTHMLTRAEICSLQMLRATSKIAVMMIKTMSTTDEMVFDKYEEEYRELYSAASQLISYNQNARKPAMRFAIDSGVLCLVGWVAQRCCRDPDLRTQLLALLDRSNRLEGNENSSMWSLLGKQVRNEEESDIDPPPRSCKDIPADKRVRLYKGSIFLPSSLVCLTVLKVPYDTKGDANKRDLWIFPSKPEAFPNKVTKLIQDTQPFLTHGNGWTSFWSQGKRVTVTAPRFHFIIPRV